MRLHERPQGSSEKAGRHAGWGCGGALAVVALLLVSAALYWQYANALPPDRMAAPGPPDHAVAKSLEPLTVLMESSRNRAPNNSELRGVMTASRMNGRPPAIDPVVTTARDHALIQQFRGSFPVLARAKKLGDLSERREWVEFASRAFAAESRTFAKRGDYRAALRSALDAVELGGVACRGVGVSDRYLSQNCQMTGLEEIERLYLRVARAGLPTQLARLRRLRREWPRLRATLEEEREIQSSLCRSHLEDTSEDSLLDRYAAASNNDSTLFGVGGIEVSNYFDFPAWGQVLTPHRVTLATVDRYYFDLIAVSKSPAPRGVPVPKVSNLVAQRFCDSSFSGQYRGEWARHNLAIAEVALAVRLYSFDNGRYPKSLSEVPLSVLPEVPVDVWDQPVCYRLRKGLPVVYSAGADRIDESGKAVDPSKHIRGRGGDLVFGKLGSSHWRGKQ